MNKRTGKLLSLLLTLAMVLGMLPAMSLTAFAAEPGISITGSTADSSGTGWSYVESTKTLTLSGYNGGYIQGSGLNTLNLVLEGTSTITVDDANAKGIALTANTTVTAVWEDIPVVTYTVSFAANGGTGTMADVTGISGEYTLPANGFTAPAGKQFKAWSVGGVEKAAGDKITVAANTTVTAVWEDIPVVTYTVSFAANGGSGTMADVTGVSGEYTLPANGFTAPSGKQFKAWSVGGTEYAVGASITVSADTTVTAIWEDIPVIEYNITVTDGKATIGAGVEVSKAAEGTEVTLTANAAPSGKVFDKWVVESGSITLANENNATTTFAMPASAVSVKATYKDAPAETYTITFNANGGTVTPANGTTGTDGKLSSLPTPTRSSSYSFKGWYTAASGGTQVTTSTVFSANMTIYAQWNYNGGGGSGGSYDPTYSITADKTENGTVSVDPKSASNGDTVTITAKPDEGYELDELIVTDSKGNEIKLVEKDGKYTFTMPASKVTVKATFMEDNTMLNYFVDVFATDYYYDAVLWAVGEGITNGTSATTFSPGAVCTRAQMATFLWRAAGSPNPVGNSNPFADVSEDSYYAKAVQWAYEQGITGGTSATTYSPDAPCTRGQMVAFLHRVAGTPKPESSTNPFTDVPDTYYTEAVQWAYEQGITSGTSATTFSPDEICTRGQMVTFLYHFFVK